ncbi:MAG TPA: tRNA (adenosine(37)-N6)-threonylcarbamoyltransferase complex ATPase subunit type 1 TsaE [Candidatus Staskawiczbacteria bacterium]|nr:tRNA (adenosine(37)-N6)-threonylcarbamoyltransferase complex ATPase subunit type 1 TsaE [Candidatus Staskawiczbacteria bacterium]
MQTITTNNSVATQKLGEDLAKDLLKSGSGNQAKILGLTGNLGGGKTTFMQGFAKGLGIKEKILSPTFVIMKHFGNFYHIDCYRINKPEEILELGFREIIADPKNIVAVEWPEKIKKFLPDDAIYIDFEFIDDNTRKITYN